ncbi:UPF0729 protein [Habropoda laboriosa]|uniref:UPF0729 protein n=1 Tax=Habropoda laboriosa TaxID=597456 RepID=A0A0L7RC33_9HYME|nr:UPF0729 protein [Habropoda laboriosa]
MVCVPCVAIPILLIIWRFLIQPLFIKWWQFKNKQKEVMNSEQPAELIKECKNGICTLSWKNNEDNKKTD